MVYDVEQVADRPLGLLQCDGAREVQLRGTKAFLLGADLLLEAPGCFFGSNGRDDESVGASYEGFDEAQAQTSISTCNDGYSIIGDGHGGFCAELGAEYRLVQI